MFSNIVTLASNYINKKEMKKIIVTHNYKFFLNEKMKALLCYTGRW